MSESTLVLLQVALSASVPLYVSRLRESDNLQLVVEDRAHECAKVLADAGEATIFRVPGKTAQAFNALAEAIACLSFSPGGLDIFGMHWESQP